MVFKPVSKQPKSKEELKGSAGLVPFLMVYTKSKKQLSELPFSISVANTVTEPGAVALKSRDKLWQTATGS